MGRTPGLGIVYGSGHYVDRSVFVASDPRRKAPAADFFHGQQLRETRVDPGADEKEIQPTACCFFDSDHIVEASLDDTRNQRRYLVSRKSFWAFEKPMIFSVKNKNQRSNWSACLAQEKAHPYILDQAIPIEYVAVKTATLSFAMKLLAEKTIELEKIYLTELKEEQHE
jgi:hypothetical protein